jgi:hypothetical protein
MTLYGDFYRDNVLWVVLAGKKQAGRRKSGVAGAALALDYVV